MKKWVEFFLDRPILVKVIIAAVFLVGLKTIKDIPKEGFPKVSYNTIIISTIYPGASARDVEQNVTIPIEEQLEEVSGIDELRSSSREGMSVVTVFADENISDKDFFEVYKEVDTAIKKVSTLPADIEGSPTLSTITSDDMPVIEYAVNGSYKDLLKFIPVVERKLRSISGVAAVKTIGLPDEEIHILIDPKKAKNHYVDLPMITGAIARRNVEGTGGTLEEGGQEKKIVSLNQYQNDEQILDTNIRMNDDGTGVKLKDVAQLSYEPQDIKLKIRNNGNPGIVLGVIKRSGHDIIKTVNQVEKLMSNMKTPVGIEMKVVSNSSTFTKARLGLTINNSIIGFILVVLILFIFFDFASAFWTAFGIPLCLFATYACFPLMDLTLNMISMGGFIVVLGLMVDDAIIVSEQINIFKEKGYSAREASSLGVQRVWKAVLAGVTTTILAFTPMLALKGFPGKFIWMLPLVVILILIFSLLDAYFILPSHLMDKKGAKKKEKKPFVIKFETIYRDYLTRALTYKKWVLLGFVGLFALTIGVAKQLKKDPFPQETAEIFYAKIKYPVGTTFAATKKGLKIIEDKLLSLPKEELLGFSLRIGTQNTGFTLERGTQNNLAVAIVNLNPYSGRDRTAHEIVDWLREECVKSYGTAGPEINFEIKRMGPPMGFAIEVDISGDSDQLRLARVKKIKKYLMEIDGVSDVIDDDIEGNEEYNIQIDYDALDRAGLTVQDVVLTLRTAFDGRKVSNVTTHKSSHDLRLLLNKSARKDINFINTLPLINKRGQLIELSRMVKIEKLASRGEIIHLYGKRTTKILANVDKKIIQPAEIVEMIKEKFPSTHEVFVSFAGETVEGDKMFADLLLALIVAIVAIYLAITLTFSSFKIPLIIMTIIPFGMTGIIFAAVTHGISLSMSLMLAIIGLTGVIVNDSIVMVDMIRHLAKEKGFSKEVVVEGAVSRLRAILLTSITTVLALIPTGYGIGGYDPFLSHMCLALCFGLMFGTLLLLFLLPSIYLTAYELQEKGRLFLARRLNHS